MRATNALTAVIVSGALLTLATPVQAAFHLWQVNEVFSNADGTIQFIEMSTSFDLQNLVNLHQIRTQMGATVLQVHVIVGNLPTTATANRSYLLATQGFADLPGGVEPDQILPDDFLDPALVDNVVFAVPLPAPLFLTEVLPTDGVNSFNATIGVAPATPENFAGEIGVLPEPAGAAVGSAALLTVAALRRRQRVESTRQNSQPR